MATRPIELTLQLNPRSRYDAIDVCGRITREYGDIFADFPRVLYFSHHTTAGYFEQSQANRLSDSRERVDPFMLSFQHLFPHGAGYRHDAIHLRPELTDEERLNEPPNGDAHLTFIGSGLKSCVTYDHRPGVPVFFMDLDGVYRNRVRQRTTSIVAYHREELVAEFRTEVPVSRHAINSVSLSDADLGLKSQIEQLLVAHPIAAGRLDIELAPDERAVGVTVNEYETLLMRHDLAEVLRNPFRFMALQGQRMLRDPRAVPAKSLGYARYDVVRIVNRLIDSFGLSGSAMERLVTRIMAYPASRRLRFKRSLSMPVSLDSNGKTRLVQGRFQSPILIQWAAPNREENTVDSPQPFAVKIFPKDSAILAQDRALARGKPRHLVRSRHS